MAFGRMEEYRCPRYAELPGLPLYMDQVVMVIQGALSDFAEDGEMVITPPMINNYVKQKHIPAPDKKRYGREHISRLIILSFLKKVFSIPDIAAMIDMLTEGEDIAAVYDAFADEVEAQVARFFVEPRAQVEIEFGGAGKALMRTAITALMAKYDVMNRLEELKTRSAPKEQPKAAKAKQARAKATKAAKLKDEE